MDESSTLPVSLDTEEYFVELDGITRAYPNGTVALSHLNLTLRRGEAVAIIGRSGSGKSTLLNILGLLDSPSSGEVRIEGHRVDSDSDRRRSQRRAADLGFVFQRSHLIGALSAHDNVLLGLRYADTPERDLQMLAADALDAVALGAKTHAIARTLSGGEMQRVAIARTIARPAQLWLADEPTGNLDSAQSEQIIAMLRSAARDRGACLVVVTHDDAIAARMDRIITLRDGQIISDSRSGQTPEPGYPADAFAAPGDERVGPAPSTAWRRAKRTARFVAQAVGAYPRRAWSGVVAAAVAVAIALTAIGLTQSASAQVNSLFDAKRAAQVSAELTTDGETAARWPVRLGPVEKFPGVTGVEYWQTRTAVAMTNGGLATTTATLNELRAPPGTATDSGITWSASSHQTIGQGEVVLGDTLAKRLGIAQPDLNPEVDIAGARFRVVGILTTSRAPTARGSAFVKSGQQTALPPSTTAELYIETVPGAARAVADRLPDLVDPYRTTQMRIDPVLGADAFRGQLEGNIAVSLRLLAIIAALAGLVAVVVVNILGVSARTPEFGVRRAFGARRSEIVSLVVGESTLLGLLGAIIGLAIGFLTIMTVTAIARWQPVFDVRLLLVPLLGALVFGIVGGLPPAIAAGRIQPADAVRV